MLSGFPNHVGATIPSISRPLFRHGNVMVTVCTLRYRCLAHQFHQSSFKESTIHLIGCFQNKWPALSWNMKPQNLATEAQILVTFPLNFCSHYFTTAWANLRLYLVNKPNHLGFIMGLSVECYTICYNSPLSFLCGLYSQAISGHENVS